MVSTWGHRPVLFWLCLHWLMTSSFYTSLPMFIVILLNPFSPFLSFFSPYSYPESISYLPSSHFLPQGPPTGLPLPLLFVSERPSIALKGKEGYLPMVHLHKGKERKTSQKRASFSNFSYSWKFLETPSQTEAQGKLLFGVIVLVWHFSPLHFVASRATVKFYTAFFCKCSVFWLHNELTKPRGF